MVLVKGSWLRCEVMVRMSMGRVWSFVCHDVTGEVPMDQGVSGAGFSGELSVAATNVCQEKGLTGEDRRMDA